MKIGNKTVDFKYFLFDGCHKFYLTNHRKVTQDMIDRGYEQTDLYPIDELPHMFYNSCPLRFIQTWEDYKRIVPQGSGQVTFNGYGKFGYIARLDFNRNLVTTDEMMFKTPLLTHDRVVFKNMRK